MGFTHSGRVQIHLAQVEQVGFEVASARQDRLAIPQVVAVKDPVEIFILKLVVRFWEYCVHGGGKG